MTPESSDGGRAQLPVAALVVLAAAFILPGLVGHDPWKQDETYIFSIVEHMLGTGDWVVPYSADAPFVEKPPLYYWVAALFARALSRSLPLHDGARLASGLFTGLTLLLTGLAARALWGRGHGRLAVLSLMSCLGLFYDVHLMTTDVPHMAGFAMACYGFALAPARRVVAGLLIGSGVGLSFLGKGLLAPAVIGVTAVLLPLLFSGWRTRRYFDTLAVAFFAVLPWLVVWPVALYMRSPTLFAEWFWENNVGRFLGFSVARLGASNEPGFWLRTLPWYAFPALPLAAVAVWRQRRALVNRPALQFGVLVVTVYLVVLGASASARGGYALPMLVGLALLAAPAIAALPERLQRGIDLGSRAGALGVLTVLWAVWALLMFRGNARPFSWVGRALPLDFLMPVRPLSVALALIATVGWLAAWPAVARLRERGAVSLAATVALSWLLIATLWLPWIDYAKSYRSVFAALSAHLPREGDVVGVGLDESVSAMLLHFCGITATAADDRAGARPSALLVQNEGGEEPMYSPPPGWNLAWQGHRPGDRREYFRLFVPGGPHEQVGFVP